MLLLETAGFAEKRTESRCFSQLVFFAIWLRKAFSLPSRLPKPFFCDTMVAKGNHCGSRFAAQKQGQHFAWRRKPAETHWIF